jgi:hypothetical protein
VKKKTTKDTQKYSGNIFTGISLRINPCLYIPEIYGRANFGQICCNLRDCTIGLKTIILANLEK